MASFPNPAYFLKFAKKSAKLFDEIERYLFNIKLRQDIADFLKDLIKACIVGIFNDNCELFFKRVNILIEWSDLIAYLLALFSSDVNLVVLSFFFGALFHLLKFNIMCALL